MLYLSYKVRTHNNTRCQADVTYTWRHRSRDHSIPHRSFPIGGPLEPSLYL